MYLCESIQPNFAFHRLLIFVDKLECLLHMEKKFIDIKMAYLNNVRQTILC